MMMMTLFEITITIWLITLPDEQHKIIIFLNLLVMS